MFCTLVSFSHIKLYGDDLLAVEEMEYNKVEHEHGSEWRRNG